MTFVPDEILMAYADGELAAEDRRQLEAALAESPELRARLEPFTMTGSALAEVFNQPLHEPVPQRLLAAVNAGMSSIAAGPENPLSTARKAQGGGFFATLRDALFPDGFGLPAAAMALAGVFIAGGMAGWLSRDLSSGLGADSALVRSDERGLYATAALRDTLETMPSMSAALGTQPGQKRIRPVLSFNDHENRFCRQYEVAAGEGRVLTGVACRTGDGTWRIPLQTEMTAGVPAAGNGYRPAAYGAGSQEVEAYIDRAISGDAIGMENEMALISGGWRHQ